MASGNLDLVVGRHTCGLGLDPVLTFLTVGVALARQEAEAVLNQLLQRRRNGYFSGVLIAVCHEGLGDIDRAVEWLTQRKTKTGYVWP